MVTIEKVRVYKLNQRKYKFIAVLLILFIVLGLNVIPVRAEGSTSLGVDVVWDGSPASALTIHLREKLPGQDGYLVVDTVTTSQSSFVFASLDVSKDYDVVVDDVANYSISYERLGNVVTVHLDKIYTGHLTLPDGQVHFTANGMPVSTAYPDFDFVTSLTRPDDSIIDLANIMNDTGIVTINGSLDYAITQPGLYTLNVSQVDRGYQNFTFDDSSFAIVYDVSAVGFNLVVQATTIYRDSVPVNAIDFYNTYVAAPVQVSLPVSVVSNTLAGQDEDFQVGMYDVLPFGMFLNTSKTIAYPSSDEAIFEVEMFPGTTYQVAFKQFANASPYYSYDGNTFIVDLETDRYGLVTITIHDDDGLQDAIAFVNEYTPEPTSCLVDFTKQISGFPEDALPPFDFTLVPDQDYQYATIKNSNLTISCLNELTPGQFELAFTQAGIYRFTIFETAGTMENVNYDQATYQVEVNVTDDHGVLSATASYFQDGQPVAGITFLNEYKLPDSIITKTSDDETSLIPNNEATTESSTQATIITTGDQTQINHYAFTMVLALGGLIFLKKRK